MTVEFPRTTYARAVREYEDPAKRVRRDVAKARAEGGLGSDFVCGARGQGGSA
jgi:hypothetical protein